MTRDDEMTRAASPADLALEGLALDGEGLAAGRLEGVIAGWRQRGRASAEEGALRFAPVRAENARTKLLRAYEWIVEHAILCETPDMRFGAERTLGRNRTLGVGSPEAYASYVLLPLLTLVTGQRLLIVGAPGRGKTTLATLMALLGGAPLSEVRRNTQHGHPQLTLADLLGAPLPGNLVRAREPEQVRVAWRSWLTQRVKIVDEYNRIPTKTQSALLSLMAEGYAEQFGQVVHSGTSAWYLTANDDLGGGTFQVIDALKDRLDAVVRAVPFEGARVTLLGERIAQDRRPEEQIPDDIRFDEGLLEAAAGEIRAVPIPAEVTSALATFAAQLEFCLRASTDLERMTKDTLRLAGRRIGQVCNEDCPLDKREHACSQVETGISTRAMTAALRYAQALAWCRGREGVDLGDLRAVLPWVLHERLAPNAHSGFFAAEDERVLLSDRVGWIARLFDLACERVDAHGQERARVDALRARAPTSPAEARALLREVETSITRLLDHHELDGVVHEDLMRLRAVHHRWRALGARS